MRPFVYRQDHKVDLLLLDMITGPGITGCETYEKILTLHPDQKALIPSGLSENAAVKKPPALGAGRCSRKPSTIENLARLFRI
jgi:DNA-binding NarL/FixJ family response regulator